MAGCCWTRGRARSSASHGEALRRFRPGGRGRPRSADRIRPVDGDGPPGGGEEDAEQADRAAQDGVGSLERRERFERGRARPWLEVLEDPVDVIVQARGTALPGQCFGLPIVEDRSVGLPIAAVQVDQARRRCDAVYMRLPMHDLSPRERDVLGHLVAGRSNDEIAAAMGVTSRAVEAHLTRLFRR